MIEPQAEAIVDQLLEVQIANVSTKDDISGVRNEISSAEASLREEIRTTRELLRDEIGQVKIGLLKWLVPLLLGQVAAFAFIMQWIVQ